MFDIYKYQDKSNNGLHSTQQQLCCCVAFFFPQSKERKILSHAECYLSKEIHTGWSEQTFNYWLFHDLRVSCVNSVSVVLEVSFCPCFSQGCVLGRPCLCSGHLNSPGCCIAPYGLCVCCFWAVSSCLAIAQHIGQVVLWEHLFSLTWQRLHYRPANRQRPQSFRRIQSSMLHLC